MRERQGKASASGRDGMDHRTQIGILVFPQVTQLDFTGPYEVLTRVSNADVHLLWKNLRPIRSDKGLVITPTRSFRNVSHLDVILVPGGPGVNRLMEDRGVLNVLGRWAKSARYVTSVCTGALVLGAAGLLRGYRATTHWAALEFLPAFGAIPTAGRVVVDRNRITGGGVTAGIDFALLLSAELRGEAHARLIELQIEYNPAPPFGSGHPSVAGKARNSGEDGIGEAA